MLAQHIRILDFDGSVTKQRELLLRHESEIVDMRDIGPQARFWMGSKVRARIWTRIKDSPKNSATFLGSGDFHHVSEILISQFDEPLSVIVFDNHPDWDILPIRLNCGSWVSRILKRKNIKKVVLIGPSSRDISTFIIQTANLSSLEGGRVEIYPVEHGPSVAFLKKVPKNRSIGADKRGVFTRIRWHELKDMDLANFIEDVLKRLPTEKVYISIDKDCLKKEYALTNWEEGLLTLGQLTSMLKSIEQAKEPVGLDITGDHSKIAASGILKKIASYLDHPRNIAAGRLEEEQVTAVNEETNLSILNAVIPGDRVSLMKGR